MVEQALALALAAELALSPAAPAVALARVAVESLVRGAVAVVVTLARGAEPQERQAPARDAEVACSAASLC